MTMIERRDFLKSTAAVGIAAWAGSIQAGDASTSNRNRLEPFDYDGVRLRDSQWQKQYQAARDFYLGLSEDDILCGFRAPLGCRPLESRWVDGARAIATPFSASGLAEWLACTAPPTTQRFATKQCGS